MWRNILAFLLTVIAIPTALVSCGKTYNAEATIGGGILTHTHSSGLSGGSSLAPATIALTGTLSSTKACANGYTRVSPNYCSADSEPNIISTSNTLACITYNPGFTDAKGVLLSVQLIATTSNAIGTSQVNFLTYKQTDSGCAGGFKQSYIVAREFVATAAGAPISTDNSHITIPTNINGQFRYSTVIAGNGNISVAIAGYFD